MLRLHQHAFLILQLLLPQQLLTYHHIPPQIRNLLRQLYIIRLCFPKPLQLLLSKLKVAALMI
jgi:hypothetical protein